MAHQILPELNYGEIIAQIIAEQRDLIFKSAAKLGAKIADEVTYRFVNVFSAYLEAGASNFCKTKTILYRNEPVPLYSFYEPLDIKLGRIEGDVALDRRTRDN